MHIHEARTCPHTPQVAMPSDKQRPETASNASYHIANVVSVPKHYEVYTCKFCQFQVPNRHYLSDLSQAIVRVSPPSGSLLTTVTPAPSPSYYLLSPVPLPPPLSPNSRPNPLRIQSLGGHGPQSHIFPASLSLPPSSFSSLFFRSSVNVHTRGTHGLGLED